MTRAASAGLFIYAKDLEQLTAFYQSLLGMECVAEEAGVRVLQSADMQMVLHAIPAAIAATFTISSPPEKREEAALKFFFTVPSLAEAERIAAAAGGEVFGPTWDGPDFRVRNGCDPEGNIFQLRERLAAATTSG